MAGRLLVATRKGLFTFTRGPSGWELAERAFLGDPVTMVLADPRDGTLYAGLRHGHFGPKLHRSDDGVHWVEVGAPTFPEGSGQDDERPSVDMIWSLEHGGTDRPGVLWLGTIPGALFRSEDRGDTWRLCESLWNQPNRPKWFGGGYDKPGIHSICVDPRDARRVLVAVSCAGVWQTVDEGVGWEQTAHGMLAEYMPPELAGDPESQDPHRVVRCPAAPDHLWAQHHCGVWRSVNGGRHWERVHLPGSSFGFTVAVHPRDPHTAWFVPAIKDEHRIPVDGRLVVARTRDGGATFDLLGEGLPGRDAYDLVYRHALDVHDDGVTLAFGSTTGNLWISECSGDRWEPLSHHLPPIYAVRFA